MIQLTKDNVHLLKKDTIAYIYHHYHHNPHAEIIKLLDDGLNQSIGPWRRYISLTENNINMGTMNVNIGFFLQSPSSYIFYILEEHEVEQAIVLVGLGVSDVESIKLASNQLKLGVNKS